MANETDNQAEQGTIEVEVVYALPQKQSLLSIRVKEGTTAIDAVRQSGIKSIYPEIDLSDIRLGLFSVECPQDQVLKDGDRVEIYRPLLADPKEIRKRRAAEMAAKKRQQAK